MLRYLQSPSKAHHHHNALDAVRQRFITARLPVVRRLGLFAEHHGRAMAEEVNRCQSLIDQTSAIPSLMVVMVW